MGVWQPSAEAYPGAMALPRQTRRALARENAKLRREREQLARVEAGGTPQRPREVESPAQIDVIAERLPCVACETDLHLAEHAAEDFEGTTLRVARLVCPGCGARRQVWFRVTAPLLQ